MKSKLLRSREIEVESVRADLEKLDRLSSNQRTMLIDWLSQAYRTKRDDPRSAKLTVEEVERTTGVPAVDITAVSRLTAFLVTATLKGDSLGDLLDDLQERGALTPDSRPTIEQFLGAVVSAVPAGYEEEQRRISAARRGLAFLTQTVCSSDLRGVQEGEEDSDTYSGRVLDFTPVGIITLVADSYTNNDVELTFQVDRPALSSLLRQLRTLEKELEYLETVATSLRSEPRTESGK